MVFGGAVACWEKAAFEGVPYAFGPFAWIEPLRLSCGWRQRRISLNMAPATMAVKAATVEAMVRMPMLGMK